MRQAESMSSTWLENLGFDLTGVRQKSESRNRSLVDLFRSNGSELVLKEPALSRLTWELKELGGCCELSQFRQEL